MALPLTIACSSSSDCCHSSDAERPWRGGPCHAGSLVTAAAKFHGERRTKLRFRMDVGRGKEAKHIYSNEFDGSINPKQFTVQRPYSPAGIMDPYNN